jgi:outer membrane protein assembly factor BamA
MRLTPLAAAVLCFASLPSLAQYTVSKVVFKNPGPYLQPDLEAVAGLHSGQKTSTAGLQTAAQQLVDTGYFDEVGIDVQGANAAMQINFNLKPLDAQRLTPVGFENFVWLTPEELAATLHTAAPLFHGALPDAGTQADTINAALAAALAAKGVTAVVTHATLEPSTSQPVRAIEFVVEKPTVRVRSIGLQGVSPAMSPAVDAIALKLKGTRYNEGLAGETTQRYLLAPYNADGYLAAKLTGVHYTTSVASPTAVEVDVTATVDEGKQYRVASLDFAGTEIAPAAILTASAKLHPGDIASRKALLETLAPVDAAYRRLGYMDVVVQSGAVLDTAAHTVAYSVTVVPGEQYRLHSVTAVGLDPAARAVFDRDWLMQPGELYNVEYVYKLLKSITSTKAVMEYGAAFKASADPQTHQVDLTLTFVRAGGKR